MPASFFAHNNLIQIGVLPRKISGEHIEKAIQKFDRDYAVRVPASQTLKFLGEPIVKLNKFLVVRSVLIYR